MQGCQYAGLFLARFYSRITAMFPMAKGILFSQNLGKNPNLKKKQKKKQHFFLFFFRSVLWLFYHNFISITCNKVHNNDFYDFDL